MTQSNANAPLAIIGIGCLFPKAEGLEAFWSNIRRGVDAITPIPPTHWNPDEYFDADPKAPDRTYARRGGFLPTIDFSPLEFGISPNTLEATDASQLLGLVVAQQALRDAGYAEGREFDRNRVSVVLGVTGTLQLVIPLGARLGHPIWRKALKDAGVDPATAEDVVARISDGYVPWQENSFPGLLGNVAAGRIANKLDLGGTNCVVDAACASSLSALHLAGLELAAGRCDVAVTGGFDTFNDIFMYMCFSKTPALSPSGNAKPFDASADGTILGEGLGVVVLKRLADARRDGDRVYATILGVGSSSDGKGNAIYAPSATGQAKALRAAYAAAEITPDTIELIEAHGTGTKVGDATELEGLNSVFRGARKDEPWCAVGSIKSQIGHTKAAAGVAGLIKAALALHHKVLPPTIKVDQPVAPLAHGAGPFYASTVARPWLPSASHPRRAGVSAFGFGGSNFHCVLEEAEPAKTRIDWDGGVQLLAFSGATRAAVAAALQNALPELESWTGLRACAARSRAAFRAADSCRLLLVAEKDATVIAKLAASAQTMLAGDAEAWSTPDGAYFATGPASGSLAMVFPGQGSQSVGMLAELACAFPQVFDAVAQADAAFIGAGRLANRLYPPPAFERAEVARQEDALRRTDVAQPAIGAVSLGALRVMEHFGVRAAAVVGHSFGELTALCAAGAIGEASFHRLAGIRGRLMAEGAGDRGAMLAVQGSVADAEAAIAREKLDLVVANRNAPKQAVLSGATAEIERAQGVLEARGLRCRRLPVAAAFHSRFVAEARAPFAQELAGVGFVAPKIPVFANATAAKYPLDPAAMRELLAGQLVSPVEFARAVEAMHAAGARTFVEVGPGDKLTGLVKAILDGRPHAALAMDARPGFAGLARALAQIAALGHAVDLVKWDAGFVAPAAKKPGMSVPLCGVNYVKPRAARPPAPPKAAPAPRVVAAPAPAPGLSEALRATQESIAALQKMQAQAAELHRKFLESQETAQQTVLRLVEQQHHLLNAPSRPPVLAAPAPAPSIAPPPPAPIPAPAVVAQDGRATRALLEVVAEKTGYPGEMLNLDMGLDTDLGIDSIKRVEILSALQERLPGAPAVKPEDLAKFRTLRQIADFLAPGATPATAPVAAPVADTGARQVLLATVAEKTGYPVEMLDLDMGLDTDLGIDSIKRVEILSALQERLPGAPAVKPEDLAKFRTLRQIADFLAPGSVPAAPVPGPVAAASASGDVVRVLLEVVAEKTGYPAEMLNLDMGLDSDLGIDSIKRVEILSRLQERLPAAPVVKPEHLGTFRTLRQIVAFLGGERPVVAAPAAPSRVEVAPAVALAPAPLERFVLTSAELNGEPARERIRFAPGAPVWITRDGSDWPDRLARALQERGLAPSLVDLDAAAPTGALAGLVILAPAAADDAFLRRAFRLVRMAGPALRQAGREGASALITVSRLDGRFGLGGLADASHPLTGGLAGLAKTAAHEWREVHCKALDVAPDFRDVESVADEILWNGPVEVGLSRDGRCVLGLERTPSAGAAGSFAPAPGELVVITGGARGVTAEAALALAQAARPALLLLGRSPAPTPEPDWLKPLADEAAIKKALLEHAGAAAANPRALGEEYRRRMANREVLRNLERLRAAGASVEYRGVDVRDAGAVRAAVAAARAAHGPVRGVIHGAGVLADRRIEDKSDEQFAEVYATKVDGLRALLDAVGEDELRFLALFSSSTGRFGRTGQVDYAVANEVLNKLARREAARRPGCRVVAINWGPWEGGMVTPGLRKVFEAEGVGLIPLAAGARLLLDEIARPPGADVEVVVMGAQAAPAEASPSAPAAALRIDLDLERFPFLESHVIDGKAVLPAAMMIEWMAHAAMHGHPGLAFAGLRDLRVLKGVILDPARPISLRIVTGPQPHENGSLVVPVEIRSARESGGDFLHARANVVLADRPASEAPDEGAPALLPYPHAIAECYRSGRLFHGADLQGILAVEGCSPEGIAASVKAAPAPSAWIRQPLRGSWIADPLALDGAFQMMILWSGETHGVGSLPTAVADYRQFRRAFPRDGVRIVARVTRDAAHAASADIEFLDREGRLVARIRGGEFVLDGSLGAAFERNRLVQRAM